jgi:ribose/xylose/arabinose/galactoside ABC-type transport system permease subunit
MPKTQPTRFARDSGVLAASWIVVFLAFSFLTNGRFATAENLELIFRQTAIVGFATLGMTFIVVSGAIDLSVGSAVALVTVVCASVLDRGGHFLAAAAAGIGSSIAVGAWNGQLVSRLKVTPFIVTLGSLLLVRGLAKGLANEQKIDAPLSPLVDLLAKLSISQKPMLLPLGVWLLILAAVAAHLVLTKTVFGRNAVAIGSSEAAAYYSGIDPGRTRRYVFLLSGVFVGLSGVMQFSRLTVGDPTVAAGLELDVIAAVVIGGASLSGGSGTILGGLIGALIMSTIRAGTSQMGLSNWIQEILTGLIIVGAVALDRFRSARN